MVHHSKKDALDERTFEKFVAATYEMEEYWGIQCRFILFVMGRCGLRKGELVHLSEEQINWREGVIEIPAHIDCDCGYCERLAEQKHEIENDSVTDSEYNTAFDEYEPGGSVVYDKLPELSTFTDEMWKPKTDAAVRSVAFDFQPRVEIAVEDFFDRFGEYTWSAASVNRRVEKMIDIVGYEQRLYPHALRATAATYHVYRDVALIPLQSMFGWANISTAMNYIRRSGKNTAKEVRRAHN